MTKKVQLFVGALVAVCAFSALVVASASALTFETAKWLAAAKTVETSLATETTGGLLFENTGSPKGAILCEGIFIGTVGSAGADTITEVQTAGKVKVTELDTEGGGGGIKCTSLEGCLEEAEAWPVNLPFKTTLMLDTVSGKYFDLVLNGEYHIRCLALLKIQIEELCIAPPNGLSWAEIENLATDVAASSTNAAEPLSECNGKELVGLLIGDAGNLTFLTSGEALQASE